MQDHVEPATDFAVEVIRSARRKKSIAAKLVDDKLIVRVPDWLSPTEEAEAVAQMVAKVKAKKTSHGLGDDDLATRAQRLNEQVLDGRARFESIRWVTNQNTRWGSCTPATGTIRISHLLQQVPSYVLDSVIVHELVHTFTKGGHSDEFWFWADKAPKVERAKGYLEAYSRFGR